MATKDQIFTSKYLKAEELKKPTVVEILECIIEPLKNNEGVTKDKPVLFFVGKKKQFVVNNTNFDSIVDITREGDTEAWAGHKIELYPTTTMMGNRKVPAIRIRAPGQTRPPMPQAAAAQPEAQPEVESASSSLRDQMDDEIPF